MAVYKCKMCGGDLNIESDVNIIECEYCGTTQTVPTADNEKKVNLFNRANRLRLNSEFDKAAGIYESIIAEFPEEAEAYWGLCLCKYGIEYVDDPATAKKIPTCHRASFEKLANDENFNMAMEYADVVAQKVYRDEAREIDRIMEEILAISKNEKPYDVFICYKETDEKGERTIDSVLAQDIYDSLTAKGMKVFFARITLEDKLGQMYEPYIFAALNSAKVMLCVGTKYEYFHAVWVKNEWSRFLKLIAKDKSKLLIPCYKDIDAYDLPEEFSHLQSQDMSKLGFMQDLIRGIKKIVAVDEPKPVVVKETVVSAASTSTNTAPLLKRVFMFLEDGDWNSANEYCEKVLDIEPENASAYLGKLLSELRVRKQELLKDQAKPFDNSNIYQKTVRFADEKLKAELISYVEYIKNRNETARLHDIYSRAKRAMSEANTESAYDKAARLFDSIAEYQDSSVLAKSCYDKAKVARKDDILSEGKAKMSGEFIYDYQSAIKLFKIISGWKDADECIVVCENKIEEIKAKAEAERIESEKRKKLVAIITPIAAVLIVFIIILNTVIIPSNNYKKAEEYLANGEYQQAINVWTALNDYKDSKKKLLESWDNIAVRETISAGFTHTVGLKADGTVVAVGYNGNGRCDVDGWTDIVAVSAGGSHTVGLKADGTVVAVGYNDYFSGRCDVDAWTDIVAVSAGYEHTVGLKADGAVVAVGDNDDGQCDVDGWTDIVAISAGYYHTVGLKADGTVVAVGYNEYGQCNVEGWKDVVAVSAGGSHTVGLKADGTVVAVGNNYNGECDVDGWTDIVAILAGLNHTVGLKADGTVVAVGYNGCSECDVDGWTDIVAISAGYYHTVGLKADGAVVAVGYNDDGRCDVNGWSNIKTPKNTRGN